MAESSTEITALNDDRPISFIVTLPSAKKLEEMAKASLGRSGQERKFFEDAIINNLRPLVRHREEISIRRYEPPT